MADHRQKKCRPREYYTIRGDRVIFAFRCRHVMFSHHNSEEELRAAVKKHRKESKQK